MVWKGMTNFRNGSELIFEMVPRVSKWFLCFLNGFDSKLDSRCNKYRTIFFLRMVGHIIAYRVSRIGSLASSRDFKIILQKCFVS